jgi:hypothetical protein
MSALGLEPDEETGVWVVKPEFKANLNGSRFLTVENHPSIFRTRKCFNFNSLNLLIPSERISLIVIRMSFSHIKSFYFIEVRPFKKFQR